MKRYVLGFLFSEDERCVALIQKNKPEWQAGRVNGIGGKIEDFDSDEISAMTREFKEETGVDFYDWISKGRMFSKDDWEVLIYYGFSDKVYDCYSATDERVLVIDVTSLNFQKLISNVEWIIKACLDDNDFILNIEYL